MLTRRHFLGTAAAAAALPAAAQAYTVPQAHMPRIVDIKPGFAAGEIHVDPGQFGLYWTLGNGRALRYSVRVGRGDLYEPGEFVIGAKKEWPSWTPTPDMIEREPEKYKQFEEGMPGGPDNPLGARALYLFQPGRGDTFLRIHGTPQPWTIGRAVSNGCVGLVNDHIEHLYTRIPMNTRVVLYPKPPGLG